MPNHQQTDRRAFTMVELLVVIAIIVLLMSLSMGAMYNFIVSARESATATTIAKVNQLLQERISNLRQMDFTDAAQRYADLNGTSRELAYVIVRKFRMKRAFPQNVAEAFGNDPARFAALSTISDPSALPAGYDRRFEGGIVLYAVLVNGETFGASAVGDDLFSGSEIRNSIETAYLPCLVDAWGEPIRFYRWPTRLFKPNGVSTPLPLSRAYSGLLVSNTGATSTNLFGPDGAPGVAGMPSQTQGAYGSDDVPNCGPDGAPGIVNVDDDNNGTADDLTELGWPGTDDYEPLNVDPDDPLLQLFSILSGNASAITQFEQGNTTTVNALLALHTPFTYNPPLILSSGGDKRLGLFEPWDTANFGYLACPDLSSPTLTIQVLSDNISNLNLSGSGK